MLPISGNPIEPTWHLGQGRPLIYSCWAGGWVAECEDPWRNPKGEMNFIK